MGLLAWLQSRREKRAKAEALLREQEEAQRVLDSAREQLNEFALDMMCEFYDVQDHDFKYGRDSGPATFCRNLVGGVITNDTSAIDVAERKIFGYGALPASSGVKNDITNPVKRRWDDIVKTNKWENAVFYVADTGLPTFKLTILLPGVAAIYPVAIRR